MKPKQINISVPEPCSEDWGKMLPEERGRFCMSCQKVVVDFTAMSDEQLLKYFIEHRSARICGRFYGSQLDRPLVIPQKKYWYSSINKRVAAVFIAVQAMLFNVRAYAMPQSNIEIVDGTQTQGDKITAITGRVVDYLTKEPVVGVKVIIEGTDYYAITDIKGGFAISVKESSVSGRLKISVVEHTKGGSSTYWSEEGTLYELANKNFTMYKYPQGVMNEVVIKDYKAPYITIGEAPAQKLTVNRCEPLKVQHNNAALKQTFWQHITKPFRKKK